MPRLKNPTQPRTPLPRRAYSVDEFMDVVGVCRASVYGMMRKGELPFVTISGRRKIPVSVVDDLLKRAGV